MKPDPLALTVHRMPLHRAAPGYVGTAVALGRWKMLAILLVCALPVMASYLTYYIIRPAGKAYGVLVEAQPFLPSAEHLALHDLQGQTVDPVQLKGQWLLISIGGGQCDARCEHLLWLQRQLRESLGKDKDRVDRVWLVDDEAPLRSPLMPALQGAQVLRASRAQIAAWLQPDESQVLADHLYLVDPMGRWMMRFPAQPEPKAVKRDIERLLRASASWDRAGREGP